MPIPLPNLDDRSYQDLVEQGRALIPTVDPEWTNHNASDPGIRLIELFAWLAEMLMYRINRVPEQHVTMFLKLINGPEWKRGPDLDEDVRATVLALRRRYRAVTADDYEALAMEAAPSAVARSRAVPERNLEAGTEAERAAPRPGHVSVMIVPASEDAAPRPAPALVEQVFAYLEPRRLVTTRLHVCAPLYVPVAVQAVVARRADAPAAGVEQATREAITAFLHPLTGGPEGRGWPFGRDVYVSELYQVLESVPGVDYVPDILLSGVQEIRHENGDLVGLGLAAHHLPAAVLQRVLVWDLFLPVTVTLAPQAAAGVTPASMHWAVKQAVRKLFHPLLGGPQGDQRVEITIEAIRTEVLGRPEVALLAAGDIAIRADERHLQRSEDGAVTGVAIEERELADLTVRFP